MFESGMQQIAFAAPEAGHMPEEKIRFTRIFGHPDKHIAMRLFAPTDSKDNFAQFMQQAPAEQKRLILYSHGNSEDIRGISADCQFLAESLDVYLIAYDYVNYGLSSSGVTAEDNLLGAAKAVHSFCIEHLRASRIVLFGRSIGSAPTVALAACTAQYTGVVLMSAFASGVRTLRVSKYIPEKMLSYMDTIFCPNLNNIKLVSAPVLIVHGQQDDIVPVCNAYALLGNIPTRFQTQCLFLGTANTAVGHNDILEKKGTVVVERIADFLRKLES